MTEMTVTEEDQKQLAEEARSAGNSLLGRAKELAAAIKDEASFQEACDFRIDINKERTKRFEKLDPIRVKLYSAYKEYKGLMDEVISPFDESLKVIDQNIAKHHRKREQEAEAEMERQRKAAQKAADDARIAAAMEAQSAGEIERAEAILEKPTLVATPRIAEPEKPKGMAFKTTWKVDPIVNLKLLIKSVADGKTPLECVIANMTVLNQMARALKGNLNIPGVKAIEESSIASSRK